MWYWLGHCIFPWHTGSNWKPFSTSSLWGLHCWLWCKKCSKVCMWCISKAQCVCVYCCHVWSNLMKLLHLRLRRPPFGLSITLWLAARLIKIWRNDHYHQPKEKEENSSSDTRWKKMYYLSQHAEGWKEVMVTLRETKPFSHVWRRLHCRFDLPLWTKQHTNY